MHSVREAAISKHFLQINMPRGETCEMNSSCAASELSCPCRASCAASDNVFGIKASRAKSATRSKSSALIDIWEKGKMMHCKQYLDELKKVLV